MAQRIDSLDGVDEFKRFYLQVSLEIDYFNVLLYLCGCYLFSEIWAMFEKPNWTGWLDLEPIVCLVQFIIRVADAKSQDKPTELPFSWSNQFSVDDLALTASNAPCHHQNKCLSQEELNLVSFS